MPDYAAMSFEIWDRHEKLKTIEHMSQEQLLAEAKKLDVEELRHYLTQAFEARLRRAMFGLD